jgi:hypothetical protein
MTLWSNRDPSRAAHSVEGIIGGRRKAKKKVVDKGG